jgi:hypothetical protein
VPMAVTAHLPGTEHRISCLQSVTWPYRTVKTAGWGRTCKLFFSIQRLEFSSRVMRMGFAVDTVWTQWGTQCRHSVAHGEAYSVDVVWHTVWHKVWTQCGHCVVHNVAHGAGHSVDTVWHTVWTVWHKVWTQCGHCVVHNVAYGAGHSMDTVWTVWHKVRTLCGTQCGTRCGTQRGHSVAQSVDTVWTLCGTQCGTRCGTAWTQCGQCGTKCGHSVAHSHTNVPPVPCSHSVTNRVACAGLTAKPQHFSWFNSGSPSEYRYLSRSPLSLHIPAH